METKVYSLEGKEVGTVDLPESLFGRKPSSSFLHEVVTAYLANQRQGTVSAKTRSEVSGGGRKPWKQKHTGRARAGSNRSPLWRKGGVVFGPKPRSFRQGLPQAQKRLALLQSLSAKSLQGEMTVLDQISIPEPRTRILASALKNLNAPSGTLLVVEEFSPNLALSSRAMAGLSVVRLQDLNAYEVIKARKLLVTRGALESLKARLAR